MNQTCHQLCCSDIYLMMVMMVSMNTQSTDSARVWAAANPTWVNGAMLIQQIQPVNAGPQSRPCSICWDAHFLKMNAAWKIWQLLMRRLSTVQEPGQTYDSIRRWWTRKKIYLILPLQWSFIFNKQIYQVKYSNHPAFHVKIVQNM